MRAFVLAKPTFPFRDATSLLREERTQDRYTTPVHILGVSTPLLTPGSDLAAEILQRVTLQKGDIIVISSKAVATTEGSALSLEIFQPSAEATKLSKQCNQDPRFTEFVLREIKRMNGRVIGISPHVLLTSLKLEGLKQGRILCPNAGADQSNVKKDYAIGWPIDPVKSAKALQEKLGVPVVISDSCCVPGRLGVTAFALVCAGLDPFRSEVGNKDLFGKTMRLTQEAIADQLATAANAVMGNSAQSVPAAIIRDSGIVSSDFLGWVEGIEQQEDIYRDLML